MINNPERLALLAAGLAFGAAGVALALTGVGVPFLLGSLAAAAAAGFVQYAALRQMAARAPAPDRSNEAALEARLEDYRTATAAMRHDLRGVMSPALMLSDRLLKHEDAAVQKVGQAVVRSIERATALLSTNKATLAPPGVEGPARS